MKGDQHEYEELVRAPLRKELAMLERRHDDYVVAANTNVVALNADIFRLKTALRRIASLGEKLKLEDILAITKPHNDKLIAEGTLDTAWAKINAIGGYAGEYDDFGKGINHAVDQALLILEELGAQDPLTRPR